MLEFFLKKNIESGLKKNKDRKHDFLSFDRIQSVLILFDIKDWQSIVPIIDDLKQNGKEVNAWTILPKSEKEYSLAKTLLKDIRVLDLHKNLNWKRIFRPEIFDEFSNLKYDTLLDLSFEDNDYMMSLRVRNTSQFNLGFRELEYKIYDFIILKEDEKTLFETYEQMKFYLAHMQ